MLFKTGFIGTGNMAEAIISSMIEKQIAAKDFLFANDLSSKRKEYMKNKYGLSLCSSNHEVIEKSDIIILAVKPQVLDEVLKESFKKTNFTQKKLIISIAAGIKTKTIESIIYSFTNEKNEKNFPVIRVMPNTPCLSGMGMSGICKGKNPDEKDLKTAKKIMDSMGKSIVVEENLMDSVTAVSGSGPAYFFYFIETLVNAGKKLGLTKDQAFELVFQTAKGSISLMEQTGEDPEVLRQKVTSKGGTTEAALNKFVSENMEKIVEKAVKAAHDKSIELSGN
ncbi:MAG: pyrroline-5-carboxylate reductase [Desulforegulaceae bacterium]|nr:pyrroline-5-carboxylate reductase [Desulforegulaceae bacterium]